ncbi:Rhs element Vgr protein [Leptothrix cholodnii SP-6]|uniref:Rhs element Vgr protein n=1 Tax=Leptothrix cholodnii (strain ATCC 51168 / LMG 8142 / SP-6) TaxID=395495 RepID=B1Y022_LEPCP|nr:phage baseplate assembly protein V [Leptothrix cholodnii]ACB35303.1 Rhs element Vgr protein [Leptothrix cholodnii SP-6]
MHRDPVFSPPPAWTHGGFLARVVSLDDPERRNRVQVRLLAFDAVAQQDAPLWARVVAPFAGDDRGVFFLPDVDDEVLVVFVQGDARYPLIVGGLWNGGAQSPADIESGGQNRYKRIKSKNGIVITLDDQSGQETLQLETPGGQKLTLKDGPGTVTIEDSNGNSIKLEAAGITVQASAKVKVQAAQVEVTAGMVKVDTAMATFTGMVKCEVLQATSVISTSYTPGAGNVW